MAGKGKGDRKGGKGAVIIKKFNIEEAGHHGGAWKVAYADFVTAMMAFFLLMWLLNATTEDQRKGLADYFSPSNLMSHNSSGTGEPFGGHTAFDKGAMVSDRGAVQTVIGKRPTIENTAPGNDPVMTEFNRVRDGDGAGQGPLADEEVPDERTGGDMAERRPPGVGGPADIKVQGQPDASAGRSPPAQPENTRDSTPPAATDAAAARELRLAQQREERAAFAAAAEQIKEAVRSDPSLADLSKQLAIDITPQGLRIQILDEVRMPMFPTGSSRPNDRARMLIQKVAPVLMKLDHKISVTGHTDGMAFPGPDRTNWELSSERANATRRLLTESGFPEARIFSVSGHADHDPLLPADPLAAANRRIAILVLREAPLTDERLPPVAP